MRKFLVFILCVGAMHGGLAYRSSDVLLEDGWRFHLGEVENAQKADFDTSGWASVKIPHDWAIGLQPNLN